jgi:AGCS family alanine or glycine:cation symporter
VKFLTLFISLFLSFNLLIADFAFAETVNELESTEIEMQNQAEQKGRVASIGEKKQTIAERINESFIPIVSLMEKVIFWDPFKSLGIYDPYVYDKLGNPVISEPYRGSISGFEGSTEIYGKSTRFEDRKVGQAIVINREIFIIEEIRDDSRITIDRPLNSDLIEARYFAPIENSIPIIVLWLIAGALFFTFRMKFINLRGFKVAIDLVRGKYDDPNKAKTGEVSHFQALATALSATVGLGNIAGVAVAIAVGGPGATFWMIVAGLLGMSSKFVECTLGVKYRLINNRGEVSGGPMYYLSNGLKKRGLGNLGQVLAALFALLCIGGSFGGGNMFQANQAFSQFKTQFDLSDSLGFWFGVVMAVLVGIVIIGGIKSIAKVTEKIVPFMAVFYVSIALVIIVMHIDQVGSALNLIFKGAFNPDAAYGGFLGVLIMGFRRAAFSNEAGVGSAAIAHSASATDEPVSEGIVALLEPFIDTVIICTMTAFVIIFTGYHVNPEELEGAELTSRAFGSVFSWFPALLVIAIFLFAFSTMISWSYYGLKAWTYLFGDSKITELTYKLLFLLFTIIGASVQSLGPVIDFSDMMILAMAFPNILGLFIMSGEVRKDLRSFMGRVKSGEITKNK